MKFMNIVFNNTTALLTANNDLPWQGMRQVISTGVGSFMTDFLVPVIAVALIILGFVQIPGCFTEYRQGQGQEFWKKIGLMALTFIVGIGLTTIWGMFASYLA